MLTTFGRCFGGVDQSLYRDEFPLTCARHASTIALQGFATAGAIVLTGAIAPLLDLGVRERILSNTSPLSEEGTYAPPADAELIKTISVRCFMCAQPDPSFFMLLGRSCPRLIAPCLFLNIAAGRIRTLLQLSLHCTVGEDQVYEWF